MGTVVPTPGNNGEVVATPIPKVRKRDKQQLTVSWTGTGMLVHATVEVMERETEGEREERDEREGGRDRET